MATGHTSGLTKTNMKANGRIMHLKEGALSPGKTVSIILDYGKKIKSMERELSNIKMVVSIKEILLMTKNMEKVFIHGQMEKFITENGRKTSIMEWLKSQIPRGRPSNICLIMVQGSKTT